MTEESIASSVVLENREKLTVSGVTEITSFNEERIELDTCLGPLCVRGKGMTVTDLSSETGEVSATGSFSSVAYTGRARGKKSFREKVFG